MEWAEFEEEFGPMTIHERVDAAAQKIAYSIHASHGGEESPDKFRTQWRRQVTYDDPGVWLRVMAGGQS